MKRKTKILAGSMTTIVASGTACGILAATLNKGPDNPISSLDDYENLITWNNVDSIKKNLYDAYKTDLKEMGLDDYTIAQKLIDLKLDVDDKVAKFYYDQTRPVEAYSLVADYASLYNLQLIDWQLIRDYRDNLVNQSKQSIYSIDMPSELKQQCVDNMVKNIDEKIDYCTENNYSLKQTVEYLTSNTETFISDFNKDKIGRASCRERV